MDVLFPAGSVLELLTHRPAPPARKSRETLEYRRMGRNKKEKKVSWVLGDRIRRVHVLDIFGGLDRQPKKWKRWKRQTGFSQSGQNVSLYDEGR